MKHKWKRRAVPYAGRGLERPVTEKKPREKKVSTYKAGGITVADRDIIREWIESGLTAEVICEKLKTELNRERRLKTVQVWVERRVGEPYRKPARERTALAEEYWQKELAEKKQHREGEALAKKIAKRDKSRPSHVVAKLTCSVAECEAVTPGDKWSTIKSGWFFMKDGTRYCTKHIPDWVEAWRAKEKQWLDSARPAERKRT